MPNISICAVTYRSLQDTKAFLDSVFTNTMDDYELILGVNGSRDRALNDYLSGLEQAGRVKLVWNDRNIGVRAFNQVMRLASTNFIFRCDSDIQIQQPYWTQRMISQWDISNKEIGKVIGVGTSNTGGYRIQRTANTTETDMIMSNCLLIHAPTAKLMARDMRHSSYVLKERVDAVLARGEGYKGEHADAIATLDYFLYHAPWWDINFGGPDEPLGYGSDDMLWSILARYFGYKLVTSSAQVVHTDASMRPDYSAERHRLVSRGFCYMRTVLSLAMNEWSAESWNGLPNNLPVLKAYRASGELLKT